MRWKSAVTAALAAAIACAVAMQADAATVTVDGATKYQTIQGGGITLANPYSYPIPLRDVAAQAYGLGFRVARQFAGTYLEGTNDDGDPFHYNWASYNVQFAADDEDFRRSKTFQDAGFEVWVGFQVVPAWMEDGAGNFNSTIPGIYDEVAEYWCAFLKYAQANYGLAYPHISLMCEPDCRPGTGWTATQFREAIKKVGARLQSEGLGRRLTTPHCALINISQSWLQTILADPAAAGHLDALAYHPYYNWSTIDAMGSTMRGFANDALIKATGLPIWQTEWTIQKCAGYPKRSEAYLNTFPYALDWAKFIHFCYAEGQCVVTTPSPGISLEYAADNGMFGLGLAAGGLRPKKFGYTTLQYHRFIKPGSRRISAAVSGASGLYVTAYQHPVNGALAIVMINRAAAPVSATVSLNNLSPPSSMRRVRTSATEDGTELSRVTVSGISFTADLPAESVTTYVGSTIADTTPPSVPTGEVAEALSDTLVRITWAPSTDTVAVAEYKILRNGQLVGMTGGTSYVDNGLSGHTLYSYTVRAFDLAGNESAPSTPVSVTTLLDTNPPAVPTSVLATPLPSAVALTWDPSTDSVMDHDLRGFRVYKASSPGGPYTLLADIHDPAATGYTDTSARQGQVGYYKVASYDDETPVNESARSSETITTPYGRKPGGLAAEYYDSANIDNRWRWFNTRKANRNDATVNFNWENVQPPAGRYIKGAYGTTYHWCLFGARWQGEVLADHSETYTFETRNLDGVRLWVDGKLIINDWYGWSTHTNSAPIALTAGWHSIRLDYFRYHPEADEDGVIQLYYSAPSVSKQIIPADHLATVSSDSGIRTERSRYP